MRTLTRLLLLGLALFTVTVVAAGCGGLRGGARDSGRLGTDLELPIGQSATVVCSNACRARAQCGWSQEGDAQIDYVFVDAQTPRTSGHSNLLLAGSSVVVLNVREIPTFDNQGIQQGLVRYYQVETGRSFPGWVAGWCLEQPAG